MSTDFIDTNVLLYAADADTGTKFNDAGDLIARLVTRGTGALSTQVLMEFHSVATRKLLIPSEEAEGAIRNFSTWTIHRPAHSDVMSAIRLQRRYRLSWWDSLIVTSAIESGASILWSEDLQHGQKFGSLIVRNPFLPQ